MTFWEGFSPNFIIWEYDWIPSVTYIYHHLYKYFTKNLGKHTIPMYPNQLRIWGLIPTVDGSEIPNNHQKMYYKILGKIMGFQLPINLNWLLGIYPQGTQATHLSIQEPDEAEDGWIGWWKTWLCCSNGASKVMCCKWNEEYQRSL